MHTFNISKDACLVPRKSGGLTMTQRVALCFHTCNINNISIIFLSTWYVPGTNCPYMWTVSYLFSNDPYFSGRSGTTTAVPGTHFIVPGTWYSVFQIPGAVYIYIPVI